MGDSRRRSADFPGPATELVLACNEYQFLRGLGAVWHPELYTGERKRGGPVVKYLFLELRDVSLELTAGGDTPADERDDVWSMAVYFRDRGGSGTTACHYRDTNDGGFAFRSGVHYKTSWTGEGFEIIGELSSKDGYKGVNIDGGDNPNGTTGKGGYNGADLN